MRRVPCTIVNKNQPGPGPGPNMAAGLGHATLDHSEVEETAGATRDVFMTLLASWIQHIAA